VGFFIPFNVEMTRSVDLQTRLLSGKRKAREKGGKKNTVNLGQIHRKTGVIWASWREGRGTTKFFLFVGKNFC